MSAFNGCKRVMREGLKKHIQIVIVLRTNDSENMYFWF